MSKESREEKLPKKFSNDKAAWESAMTLSKDYRKFLDASKTERLAVKEILRRAKAEGFVSFSEIAVPKAGDRIYFENRHKSLLLVIIGKKSLESGVHLVASHLDSPRLDIKQNPFKSEEGLFYLTTHYYGLIRKYQWLARPLAIAGIVYGKNDEVREVILGNDPDDPVFYISDLLPHLSKSQDHKSIEEAFKVEKLNLIIGSGYPLVTAEKALKDKFLKLLGEDFGIREEDFVSAEFEVFPAGKARDVGFDRSMVAAYGQDDKLCAFASLESLLRGQGTDNHKLALFVDKEEVGNIGNTSMSSLFFKHSLMELLGAAKVKDTRLSLGRMLMNSVALSGDVVAGMDPAYREVTDSMNTARLGGGASLVKYTGLRGKESANDANGEYVGQLRNLLDSLGIPWQTSEFGYPDAGGGYTISHILANMGLEVMDLGAPVFSMHSPDELSHKMDLLSLVAAYEAFYDWLR
jgi:aspartyl aminopeptidase